MITSSTRVVQYALTYPFGSTYAINFKFWSAAQIHAVLSFDDGTADLPLVLSTDFTLSAPGDTGTLTKVSDWNHAAVRLTIYRELDLEQETDYRNGEAVDLDLLEKDFDYTVARDQQIAETVGRGVTVPITDEAASNELPGAAERANKFLGFDADGVPFAAEGIPSVPVSPFMATLLDDLTAGAGLSTLGVSGFVQTLLDDADATAAKNTMKVGFEIFTPATGYTPSNGDVVELMHDGKIRKAKRVSVTILQSGSTVVIARCAAISETQFVVVYAIGLNIYCKVGTVNLVDLSISYGTQALVKTCTTTLATFDVAEIDSTRVLVAYHLTGSAANQLSVAVISVSGTTATVNTAVNGAASAANVNLRAIPGTTNVMMTYQTTTTNVVGAVVSVSGTTPTIGTISGGATITSCSLKSAANDSLTVTLDGTAAFISYHTATNNAVGWTISGTSATVGTVSNLTATAGVQAPLEETSPMVLSLYKGDNLHAVKRTGVTATELSVPVTSVGVPFLPMAASNAPTIRRVDGISGVMCCAGSLASQYNANAPTPFIVFVKRIGGVLAFSTEMFTIGDVWVWTGLSTPQVLAYPGICSLPSGVVIVAGATNTDSQSACIAIKRRNTIVGIVVDVSGLVQVSGIYTGSGFTAGAEHGVDDQGAITSSTGEVSLGVARSATELMLNVRRGI